MAKKVMFYGYTKDIKSSSEYNSDEKNPIAYIDVRTDSAAMVSMIFRKSDNEKLFDLVHRDRYGARKEYEYGDIREIEEGVFRLRSGRYGGVEAILPGKILRPADLIDGLYESLAVMKKLGAEEKIAWRCDRDSESRRVMECVKDIETLVGDARCDASLKPEIGRLRYDIEFLIAYTYKMGDYRDWDGLMNFLKEHVSAKFEAMKGICERIVIQRDEES